MTTRVVKRKGKLAFKYSEVAEPKNVKKRPPTTERVCLKCGKYFQSEGIQVRMCGRCKDLMKKNHTGHV